MFDFPYPPIEERTRPVNASTQISPLSYWIRPDRARQVRTCFPYTQGGREQARSSKNIIKQWVGAYLGHHLTQTYAGLASLPCNRKELKAHTWPLRSVRDGRTRKMCALNMEREGSSPAAAYPCAAVTISSTLYSGVASFASPQARAGA